MLPYPWLNTIYNKILHSYVIKRGHHALLFYSQWDQGEDVLINFIIRWLICSNPYKTKFCDICQNCHLMKLQQHPDYYLLDLQDNIESIGIDKIRICIDAVHYSTRYSKAKVIFIKYVEYLTNQAMYVLLKTLEHPPENTYFFLKTKEYMKIPVTLSSRCMKWSIHAPEESIGLSWLIKSLKINNSLSIKTALRLCNNSPIEASSILQSQHWQKRLELYKIINYVIINNGDFLEFLPYFEGCQNNSVFLYWFITLLIDALKKQQNIHAQFLINMDQIKLLTIISKYWNILSLNNQVKQWLILFRYFQEFNNVNYKLLLTHRLLNWKHGLIETYFLISLLYMEYIILCF